ncbi:hypothetical protein Tco_1114238 [Tanacetum coccineum]|uniref:Uncharacterized protein n=1 Tax=Tanacetum coccineum TaxID=301880 RepID=A0ABQ5IUH6_9ASTR
MRWVLHSSTEKEESCEKHPASIEWNHQEDVFTNMIQETIAKAIEEKISTDNALTCFLTIILQNLLCFLSMYQNDNKKWFSAAGNAIRTVVEQGTQRAEVGNGINDITFQSSLNFVLT